MARKSGKSTGSRNSGKSEGSDRSNKIDLGKEGSDIDLKKNDDIKLDDKESDSDNFGEFSKEIELYNDDEGTSISGVVGVDIVPLGLNISANGDIGTVGIDIGLPGDVIGIGGSLNVNLETGEIVGGAGNIDYGGVSVEVSTIKNDGETCTSLTITYFGVGVSYQRCKKDNEDDEKEPPKEPPPEPPPELTPEETENNDFEWPKIPQPPGSGLFPGGPEDNVLFILGAIEGGGKQFIEKYRDLKYSKTWLYAGRLGPGTSGYMHQKWQMGEVNDSTTLIIDEPGNSKYSKFPYLDPPGQFLGGAANIGNMTIRWAGKRKDFDLYYTGPIIESSKGENGIFYAWSSLTCLYAEINDQPVPPPEPPIPPEDDMSNCCDLEPVMSLLRKVSKAVGEVGTAIGTDQLPANLPKSFLKNEGFRKIPSLAELAVYHVEIMDQLIGKFPIELEIKDTDPLSAGDQTKKVVLTNLAESVAELFGLAINSASDNAIQTSGSIKNLLEITLVRQAVLQNYYRLDAILDYLGAGLEEDEATFNSTISLPKDPNNISEDVADFLQQSEIKFAYDKLSNPKDTLTAKLLPIQKAADIIKAKYWKGFGKAGGDYLGAIKSWLETYDPKNEQNDTEWKDKIDKILEEYAKDQAGNIDKDRMPVIQNVTQIGSEPKPPGA